PTFSTGDGTSFPSTPSLRTYLQTNPMEVDVRAKLTSITGFFNWTVTATKVGYREIPNQSSFPARFDCAGNLIVAGGTPPASCPCVVDPNNPRMVQNGAQCDCLPGLTPVRDGLGNVIDCVCNTGFTLGADQISCVCPPGTVLVGGICCPPG